MFYVGVYSTFHGKDKVETTKVKIVEKFGPHAGRGKRWLDAHPPKQDGDDKYRAIVFVLPRGFRLSNDVVKLAANRFKCDWQTAKFHVYRECLVDVIGNKDDWQEFFPKEAPTEAQPNTQDGGYVLPGKEGAELAAEVREIAESVSV
jgi:hypothetical protein